jgi:hypothetical protein
MAEKTSSDPTPRSPLAGCAIMIVAICSMLFLVGFVIWNMFKLDDEISKFTTAEAQPTPVPDLVSNAAAFNKFQSKLELFRDAHGKEEVATLKLSPEDMNLAIATYDEFSDLRGTFSILSIEDGRLHIAISFPLGGKPMSKGELRFLNGTMIAEPQLAGDEIILVIDEILVPGAEVPDGFIGQMSPYRVTMRYMEDKTLGPWMKSLTNLTVQGGLMVLTSSPAEAVKQAAPKDPAPFIKRAALLAGGIISIFLVLVVALVLVSRRRKGEAVDESGDRE